jgi:hypothetical protein
MKRLLKTTSLFSLIAISGSAFAQSATDAANFSPRLKLQSRFSFSDSYRKNQMDLITNTARFGLNYRYKNVTGTLEVQAGSASDTYTSASTSSSSTTTNTSTSNGNQSLFNVRRANIGLDLYASDPATVSLNMGRDRIVASLVYAPDALAQNLATNMDNVSSLTSSDGLGLKYSGKFEFGKIGFGVGSYNNIAVATQSTGSSWFGNSSIAAGDNSFNVSPKTQSRAIQTYLSGDINAGDGVVEARVGYGAQSNTVTKVTNANSITTYTARDVSNLEVSAGYNYMNSAIKGGVWYQSVVLGKTSTATSSSKNDLTYTASATDDSQTINTVGVGVTGNSKLWGMVDLLSTGDALTYALGYQNATGQLVSGGGGSTGVASFANSTLTTDIYNVGIGYMQEKFSLEFNYAMSNASKEIYLNSDAVQSQTSANLFYLVGTISL